VRLAPAVTIGFAATIGVGIVGDVIHQSIAGFPLPIGAGTWVILIMRGIVSSAIGGAVAASLADYKKQRGGVYLGGLLVLKVLYVVLRHGPGSDGPWLIALAALSALAAVAAAVIVERTQRRRDGTVKAAT
jgi:hypothetical protein